MFEPLAVHVGELRQLPHYARSVARVLAQQILLRPVDILEINRPVVGHDASGYVGDVRGSG